MRTTITKKELIALLDSRRRGLATLPKLDGYQEIAAFLRDVIRDHPFPNNARLPTLLELAGLFRVAPMTVRRAIDFLRKRGWVVSLPHKGIHVRRSWGNPPAEYHLAVVSQEFLSPQQSFASVIPWVVKGLKASFEGIGVQVVMFPCHLGNALETISRACLDAGVNATLITTQLPAEAWSFLDSHQVPTVSLRGNPGPHFPCIRLDTRRAMELALQSLAAPSPVGGTALISYFATPEMDLLREDFRELAGGPQLVIPNEPHLGTVDYAPIYHFIRQQRPSRMILMDEAMAFHARRAALLIRLDCRIVMLECVLPELVWPGDAYVDTTGFYYDASLQAGQLLRKWLLTQRCPPNARGCRWLAPRLNTAPEIAPPGLAA